MTKLVRIFCQKRRSRFNKISSPPPLSEVTMFTFLASVAEGSLVISGKRLNSFTQLKYGPFRIEKVV